MSREAFYNLLKRYLEGKCTEEEKKVVEQWYSMLDDEDLPDIHKAELSSIAERTWHIVKSKTSVPEHTPLHSPSRVIRDWLPRLGVAASIIGVLLLVGYLFPLQKSQPHFMATREADQLVQKVNSTSQPMEILLGDGSTVILQPQSELTFPKQFSRNRREAFIRGEALFQVEKNPEQPFYVYSNALITQVIGTRFIVRANEKTDQSEVVVLTGKVIVTKSESHKNIYQKILPEKSETVILTPNQKVVYQKEEELAVTLVQDPTPISSENEDKINFLFNETPLSVVIAGIEKTYGIKIMAMNKEINQCTFTGDLTEQNLYDMLDFIGQSIGATYKIEGAKILIEGGNCN